MPDVSVIHRKHRQVNVGDLDRRITLHDRSMVTPAFQGADLSERFNPSKAVWASVNTIVGKTIFSGVNVDVALSHEIFIRFDDGVNSETWIEFEKTNLKIIAVEDLDERHEWLRILCTERGDVEKEAAFA